jgi:hypothetical protein
MLRATPALSAGSEAGFMAPASALLRADAVRMRQDLDEAIIRFLKQHPGAPILRIAQEVLPELFHQRATERAITYAWLSARLSLLSNKGVLCQEQGALNATVWTVAE